jgi:hypothetical protein
MSGATAIQTSVSEGAVRERRSVDVADGQTLSVADLLRMLDVMRHEMAVRIVGHPGAFIGYDTLTVSPGTISGPARIIVESRLKSRSERLHNVEYVAVSVPLGAEQAATTDLLLARGTGRTLHIEPRSATPSSAPTDSRASGR